MVRSASILPLDICSISMRVALALLLVQSAINRGGDGSCAYVASALVAPNTSLHQIPTACVASTDHTAPGSPRGSVAPPLAPRASSLRLPCSIALDDVCAGVLLAL